VEDGKHSGGLKKVELSSGGLWNEFEKVLAWEEVVFSFESVTGRRHLGYGRVSWDEMLFRES